MKKSFVIIMIFLSISLSGFKTNQNASLVSSEKTISVTTETTTEEFTEDITDIFDIPVPDTMPENAVAYTDTCSTYLDGEFKYLLIYSYDEKGNLLVEEKLNPETKESESISHYAYIYNEQDFIEFQYFDVSKRHKVFLYDKAGNVLETLLYVNADDFKHTINEYDANQATKSSYFFEKNHSGAKIESVECEP